MVSALGSRVGLTPARKERTNDFEVSRSRSTVLYGANLLLSISLTALIILTVPWHNTDVVIIIIYLCCFAMSRSGRREKYATSWTTWCCLTNWLTRNCTKKCRATSWSRRPSCPNDWKSVVLWRVPLWKNYRLKVDNNWL